MMSNRKAGVAFVVVLFAALVGCEGVPVEPHGVAFYTSDSQYHGKGTKVVVLGDSNTNAVHDRIHNQIGFRSTLIASMSGEGFAGGPWTWVFESPEPIMVQRAQEFGATGPQVAIVALGTNDAWYPPLASTDPMPPLDSIYAALGGACIVGVLVVEDTTAVHFDAVKAAAINNRVRQSADVVVDWRLSAQPADIAADGIHLTEQGRDGYIAALRAGVDACLAATA